MAFLNSIIQYSGLIFLIIHCISNIQLMTEQHEKPIKKRIVSIPRIIGRNQSHAIENS